jgi:hypothetical protein
MNKKAEFWRAHVVAVKREGVSTSAYAKRHALAVKSLYYWQRKLNGATCATAVASRASAFVALRMDAPVAVVGQAPAGCALLLGCGMRLEMAMLPTPEWLVALGRAAQGAR